MRPRGPGSQREVQRAGGDVRRTPATDRGQMVIIACSDPAVSTVAPFGGIDPVFTPDPPETEMTAVIKKMDEVLSPIDGGRRNE